MNRNTIPAVALAILALSASSAAALGFLDLTTGDEALLPDARSIALGRTQMTEPTGAFTGRTNPALLARLDHGVVSLGGSVLRLEESRAFPAYDSFDGFLVESIYAFNDEYQWQRGAGVATGLTLAGFPVGFGFSVSPVRDFQYDYSEEVRDNNAFTQPRDRLIALNEVQSDGWLDAWTIGAGCSVREDLDVGVSLEFLHGHQDVLIRTIFEREGRQETSLVQMSTLDGRRALVGAAYHPNHRVSLAASWTAEIGLDGDALRGGDASRLFFLGQATDGTPGVGRVVLTYPQEVKVGALYRPRARMATTVRLDANWTEWSAYRNSLIESPGLNDVWDVRGGIEHVFYNGMPVRFGFRWAPSPVRDEVATTAFTFGAGFRVGPLRADLAFEVSNREYRYEDLFDDAVFGGTTRRQKDLVQEDSSSLFGTLTYDLPTFGG